jgi:hypothetical protein
LGIGDGGVSGLAESGGSWAGGCAGEYCVFTKPQTATAPRIRIIGRIRASGPDKRGKTDGPW